MKRFLVVFLILAMWGCSSPPKKIEYKPTLLHGCVSAPNVNARLACISKMLKTLEGINNADITVTTEKLSRIDEEFISVKDTYCFVSKETGEVFLCFDAIRDDFYDPTWIGKVYGYAQKVGIGFFFGVVTGIYVAQ